MKTEKNKNIKNKVKKNKTMKKHKGGNISMFAPIAIGSVAIASSLVKKNKVCYKGKTHNQSDFESLMNNSDAVKKCPPKEKYGRCNTCKKSMTLPSTQMSFPLPYLADSTSASKSRSSITACTFLWRRRVDSSI